MRAAAMALALLAATTLPCAAHASVTAIDDAGNTVTLPAPAQRVVSLAPHVTELLYAAGGGAKVVGAVAYSDYPPEAQKVPRVGDNRALDLERIAALKPELIVVWRHGNAQQQLDRLRALHIPLFQRAAQARRRRDLAHAPRCAARHARRRAGRREGVSARYRAAARTLCAARTRERVL